MVSLKKLFLKYGNHVIQNTRTKHCWIIPKGLDIGAKVYNCVTKRKEPVIIRNKQLVTWYTCGPTVYDSSHMGHASCYVKIDIIQNILKNYFNCNLVTVMNITDIDDKIIKKANDSKCAYKEIAEKYEKEFWDDLKDLGINKPNIVLRVTNHISLIIDFVKKLEENGQAYKGSDNSVYFSVEKFQHYGKLHNISLSSTDQESNVKKSNLDFALWKNSKEGEPFWNSPWGKGRPGWHIECSALASHFLGKSIDFHAGGIDLRFPHHENEEAQSCALHKTCQWVNYWLHTGHLNVCPSEKMSKSLGNTILIRDMLKKTSADIFRMACIMSPYQNHMEYSSELLITAENIYNTYKNFFVSCDAYEKGYLKGTVNSDILNELLCQSVAKVHIALCDNFDTPSVIKILNELVSVTNAMMHTTASSDISYSLTSVCAVKNYLLNILNLFGLNFDMKSTMSEHFTEVLDILNNFRQDVRTIGLSEKNSNILKLCDNVRDGIKKHGVIIKDHGKISSWSV
ncbi:cysteine--tRNA ligase-like protein, mitochondrial [Leptinotarsa decemlineata]|uniref:cysteine--tRNA ligase-like protein, mitochondrial n=1 Tax=Leptinotarsa decemlineata TaxID=7539 RepID=UPI000C251F9B|nr:cysteine--tRNA ligase [Leptinotarsa decemlineata]